MTSQEPGEFHLTHPPLFETVLGFQFDELDGLETPHIGLYWSRIRDRYPAFSLHQPLPQVKEEFRSGVLTRVPDDHFQVSVVNAPDVPRSWFTSEDGARVIQMQKSRFLRNWRKTEEKDEYPHFRTLAANFEEAWEEFISFLVAEGLAQPKINQAELTYINHVDRSRIGGARSLEANDLLCFLHAVDRPEGDVRTALANVLVSFTFPTESIRVHVSCKSAVRRSDGGEIFVLEITGRGKPASAETAAGLAWLEMAHEKVLEVFRRSVRSEMLAAWGARHE